MGGTLTLWLANKYKELGGVILINPALSLPAYETHRGNTKPRFIAEEKPDIKANHIYEITYQKVPVRAINELQKLMDLAPQILAEIDCPILGFKSKDDHIVPPESTDYIMNRVGSERKQISTLYNSYHVATMDNDKDLLVTGCHDFVQHNLKLNLVNF